MGRLHEGIFDANTRVHGVCCDFYVCSRLELDGHMHEQVDCDNEFVCQLCVAIAWSWCGLSLR